MLSLEWDIPQSSALVHKLKEKELREALNTLVLEHVCTSAFIQPSIKEK